MGYLQTLTLTNYRWARILKRAVLRSQLPTISGHLGRVEPAGWSWSWSWSLTKFLIRAEGLWCILL